MNIVDAIKSGKRYRRPPGKKYDPNFWYPALCPSHITDRTIRTMFTFEDMIADDWEIEETPVIINETKFRAAWKRAVKKAGGDDITYDGFQSFRDLVAKELGL